MQQAELVRPAESNGLGLAGFIVSLLGLLGTGGILCPVGLIMSLVALKREPRGFAIAGVVLGFLGTCGGLIVVVLFGTMILAALGLAAAAIALADPQRNQMTTDFVVAAGLVEQYRDANDSLPGDLVEAGASVSVRTDPWGNQYRLAVVDIDPGYDIISSGADGIFDTPDDQSLSGLSAMWTDVGNVQVRADDDGVYVEFGETVIEVDDATDSVVVTQGETRVVELGEDGAIVNIGGDESSGDADSAAPAAEPTTPAGESEEQG